MNKPWASTPSDLRLSPDHVDIWCVRLDLPEQAVSGFTVLLSDDERTRAGKFASEQKSREFIITRGSLREILGHALHEDPRRFNIDYEAQGRPYLNGNEQHSRIHFSVTHSHELALIAMTMDHNIGIDLEKIRTDIEHTGLSRRFFSTAEYQALQHYTDAARLRAFFATWTRKEAIIKATGIGIALGLKQFDVSVDPDQPAQLQATRWEQKIRTDWVLTNIDTEPGYIACLAVTGRPSIRYWYI